MFDGKQIYLRPLEREDLPLRVKWVNDPDVRKHLMFDYPISLAKTGAWFAKTLLDDTKRNFSVVDKASGQVVGMTGLIQIDIKHRRAQFYITLGEKEFWGKKIVDEVIPIVLHYGFTELNLNKIFLYTIPGNERARKVYERNGFVQEAAMRQHYYCVGELHDLIQHSILKSEWLEKKDKLKITFDD